VTWSLLLGFLQVIIGLGFIFSGGVAWGREEKWYWVVLLVIAGLIVLLAQLSKFFTFVGPLVGA